MLDGIAADLGFVPNLAAVTAASPTLLAAFDALRRAVADPTFPPVHREIAGLAVGVAVDNAYGVAFHSTVLALARRRRGRDRGDARRRRSDRCGPRRGVPLRPRRSPSSRGNVDDDVDRRAHAAGLTDADLLQLVAECAFAGLVGMIDNLAGRVAAGCVPAAPAVEGGLTSTERELMRSCCIAGVSRVDARVPLRPWPIRPRRCDRSSTPTARATSRRCGGAGRRVRGVRDERRGRSRTRRRARCLPGRGSRCWRAPGRRRR